MRACFLGQDICSMGHGVAILRAPRLVMDEPACPFSEADTHVSPDRAMGIAEALIGSRPVANPPRAEA